MLIFMGKCLGFFFFSAKFVWPLKLICVIQSMEEQIMALIHLAVFQMPVAGCMLSDNL